MRSGRALEQMKAEVAAPSAPTKCGSRFGPRNGTEFRDSLRALADSADGLERILDLAWGPELETRILGKAFRQNSSGKITIPQKSRSVVIIGHKARGVMKLVRNHD